MPNMAKVSIIIPCYNQGRYLSEAIRSVEKQTYQDIETIVVDDGSDDEETIHILQDDYGPKTRILHTENQGLSAARNYGISQSNGTYILPLDADDMIGAGYVEEAVRVLDKYPEIGIVYCEAEHFGVRGGRWELPEFSLEGILWGNIIFCSAVFRKRHWEEVGGYNINMVYGWEDWDFWLSLIRLNLKVYKIPKTYFFYRLKEVSMDASMNEEQRFFMRLHACLNHRDLYRHMANIQIHFRVAELYLDTGIGFNPRQVLRKVIFTDQQIIEFDLSNWRKIQQCRFDPINAPASLHLKEIRIIDGDGTSHVIEDYHSNALHIKDNNLIFETADPQILFSSIGIERPTKLIIRLNFISIGHEVFHDILNVKNDMLSKKQTELHQRSSDLVLKDAEIHQLNAEIHQLNAEIHQRNAEIHQRSSELVIKNAEIHELNAGLHELNAELRHLMNKLKASDDELRNLREVIVKKEAEIEEIFQSRSWRITRPVRFFGRLFRSEEVHRS
jgi:glycosyltransferase involved in cell wall biosynthesis